MYLNSVYMHKETNDQNSISQNEHFNKQNSQSNRNNEKD